MKKDIPAKNGRTYFQSSNNKETKELETMLSSMKPEQQKDAMKQIIASMTIGKDVSSLFSFVINCMRTKNVELKKLIYLYIINYAKVKPDLTILGVASFNTDARDESSALIRGLAVRTMGCIRVNAIVQYLCEILTKCLKDNDAYVRKIAALCVAKLYITNPNQVNEHGFINELNAMLQDPNAIVIANALSALNEISTLSGQNLIKIKSKVLKKILLALPEANEWSQVCILDALIMYNPKKQSQAEDIIEGVLPRLSHANASVVMSAMKVILKFMDNIENFDKIKSYSKKLSNSLVSLMISGPEIQYVLLRSLHAVIQKRPMLLDKEFKFFFTKYNDPIYVKLEKIDILYKLTDNSNFESILKEFKSYAMSEFDSDLIKKSIRYLGYIGIKFEKSLDLCVDFLKEIIDNNNSEIGLNEAIVISRDLIRKYKGRTLEIVQKINSGLIDSLTTSEARSAVIYLIGEYCTMIPQSTQILSSFVETYTSESTPSNVKLQILNSAVKNYVNKPDEADELVKICLQKGAEESENPDDRDRAYIYWRLLEIDADMAKEMITAAKPAYDFNEDILFDAEVIDDMIENMTNVSSVYHTTCKELIQQEDMVIDEENQDKEKDKEKGKEDKEKKGKPKPKAKKDKEQVNIDADLLGIGENEDDMNEQNPSPSKSTINPMTQSGNNNMGDLLDIFGVSPSQPQQMQSSSSSQQGFDFLLNQPSSVNSEITIFNPQTGTTPSKAVLILSSDKYSIHSSSHRNSGSILIGLNIDNKTYYDAQFQSLKVNPNSFSLNAAKTITSSIPASSTATVIIQLEIDESNRASVPPMSPYTIECIALISNEQIKLNIPLNINCLFIDGWKLSNEPFIKFYQESKDKSYNKQYLTYTTQLTEDSLKKLLERNNITFCAKNNKAKPPLVFYSGNILEKIQFILEIEANTNSSNTPIKLRILSQIECVIPLVKESLDAIFQ